MEKKEGSVNDLISGFVDLKVKDDPQTKIQKLIKHYKGKVERKFDWKGVFPVCLIKGKDETVSVTEVIKNHSKNKKHYIPVVDDEDVDPLYYKEYKDKREVVKSHNSMMGMLSILGKLGVIVLTPTEFAVCDTDMKVSFSHSTVDMRAPLGAIDSLLYDPSIKKFVVCDVKTVTSGQSQHLKDLVVKECHAIQLSMYSKMLENMAKRADIDIEVGYMLIIGVDYDKNQAGAWRIERNDEKWLLGKGIEENWHPLLKSL